MVHSDKWFVPQFLSGKTCMRLCVYISPFPNAISIWLLFLREWEGVEQNKANLFPSFCVSQLSLPSDTFRSKKYFIIYGLASLSTRWLCFLCMWGAPIVRDFPDVWKHLSLCLYIWMWSYSCEAVDFAPPGFFSPVDVSPGLMPDALTRRSLAVGYHSR